MKKVYFACSIRGGRDDAELYKELISSIKNQAIVLTEIFADTKLTASGMDKPANQIWAQDLAWIRESDLVIAEVTNPSLGVGYEIAKAEAWSKPVLALYREQPGRKLSAMILGSDKTVCRNYKNLDDATKIIADFLST